MAKQPTKAQAGYPAGAQHDGKPYVWLLRSPVPGEVFQGCGRSGNRMRESTLEMLADLAYLMHTVGGKQNDDGTFNPSIPAGYTYLGQLIAHDMMDTRPLRSMGKIPGRNFRAPLSLEAIYGGGSDVSPWLYEPGANPDVPRCRLRLGWTRHDTESTRGPVPPTGPDDIPRLPDGGMRPADQEKLRRYDPMVGDRRNDENLVLSQLVVTFHKFHNRIVSVLNAADPPGTRDEHALWERARQHFRIARHLTLGAYHEIILRDYLPRLVDASTLQAQVAAVVQRGGVPSWPGIPVEFALAAFRFGHAMVANHYRYSDLHFETDATLASLIEFAGLDGDSSGLPLASHWIIDWRKFFFPTDPPPTREVNLSRRIRPAIAGSLGTHSSLQASDGRYGGLDYRTLARGFEFGLWKGQSLAQALGINNPLTSTEIAGLLQQYAAVGDPRQPFPQAHIQTLADDTPLYFYILAEAELREQGQRLGPLGGEIVARVMVDMVAAARETLAPADQTLLNSFPFITRQAGVADMIAFVAYSAHGIR